MTRTDPKAARRRDHAVAVVRVLDEALFPVMSTHTVRDVTGAEAWRWWQLDLGTMTATATGLPPSAAGATELTIDGRSYTSLSKKDFSETTLLDLAAPGGPAPALTIRGYADNGLRVH